MTSSQADKYDALTVVSVAKRQWEKTFDAISDPLMIVDQEFAIRRANVALAEDLGVAVQRLVGRRCFEVRAQSERSFAADVGKPCSGCPVADARRVGVPRDGELNTADGRIYKLRAYPLDEVEAAPPRRVRAGGAAAAAPDASVPLVVCSYHDVTEEREMTRSLSNAEKLAAVGRLAGGVAHEINNPLGAVLAFAQILLREACTPEERTQYTEEIERSALRCKEIVQSLLRFSRQSPNAPRAELSLNAVVREAVQFLGYKFSVRDVELRCRLPDDLPDVLGNANQIEQVLVNLLSNAFDSVSTVPSGAGRAPRGGIDVSTSRHGDWVHLEVADTGTGIDDAHMAKIFDPFFSTKEEGKGTGLGLAVSEAIVREHGGRIAARNRAEGGAVFTVTLPVPGSGAPAADPRATRD